MTQRKLFVLILAVNALVVLVYFIWNLLRKKEKRRSYLYRVAIMVLCPLVGPCFFLFSWIFYRLFFFTEVDLEDVIFSKDRSRAFIHAEEERERNLAPLEEAIEITDTEELRSLMMNVVRGDIRDSLAAIALAMNSEDTETAHYAASVLQDALNGFRINVQKTQALIREDEENRFRYAETLIGYMDQVLRQNVFTRLEQEDYVEQMDAVCELLYTQDRERLRSSHFEAICLRLLDVEAYERCELWCTRAAARYPQTLAAYSCRLKLYFSSGQREKFFKTLEELRHSRVVIDRETLELIRVFQ